MTKNLNVVAKKFYQDVERNPPEAAYYDRYVNFVKKYAPSSAKVLELGCGSGLSSALLSQQGFDVTGIDINESLLLKRYDAGQGKLTLAQGDVSKLPFKSATFDVVCSFDLLEHLTDIKACLEETLRVLRPGGVVVIVGPNLLSPLFSLTNLAAWATGRNGYTKMFGPAEDYMYGSPWGTSGPKIIQILSRNFLYNLKTFVNKEAIFFTREPDFTRPPHGDIDSITLTNPIAFRKYFVRNNFLILKYQGEGRSAKFGSFAGGVWIVAQKPL